MKTRDITILSFGDRKDYDEYIKFDREKNQFLKRGFSYQTADYENVLNGKLPEIETEKVIIFLFFPFEYWNKNIEHKHYKGVYGNHVFYDKFLRFCSKVDKIIKVHFSGKQVLVINNPLRAAKCRDKDLVKRRLTKAGVLVPKSYSLSNLKYVYSLLNKGICLFLKPRYGSMGKGITYLSPSRWQTNFTFRNNKIISRKSDYGWKFKSITGNSAFLSQLIKKDIIAEEEIDSLVLRKRKLDLRIYTFFKQVIYIYPKTNYPEKVTTNISQGAKGSPGILKFVPKHLLAKAKQAAVETSKALNLDLSGIDVLLDCDQRSVYVVDVNVFPGYPKRRTFNLARTIVQAISRADDRHKIKFRKLT